MKQLCCDIVVWIAEEQRSAPKHEYSTQELTVVYSQAVSLVAMMNICATYNPSPLHFSLLIWNHSLASQIFSPLIASSH